MLKKITKYKKYILSIVSLIMLLTLFFGINKLMQSKNNEPLPEVKLRKINKTKAFAIMVQNGDIYEEYNSKDNKWPGSDYVFKEAKCTDNNGALVEEALTYADGKVTLETDKTIYCTLYFDEKSKAEITNASKICDMGTSMSIEFSTSGPVGEYYYSTNGKDFTKESEKLYSIQKLKSGANQKIYVYVTDSDGKKSKTQEYDFTTKTLGKSMTASELKASNPKDLYTETTQGGMYRYQAAPADATAAAQMTNWVMFGAECTNEYTKLSEEEKIDKYMYRIIGITEDGEMKLIKETFIKEGNTSGFAQNDRYYVDPENERYCPNGKCPDWPDSQLFKRLNGTSNGTQTGSGTTLDKEWTDIFVDSEKYDYLRSGDNKNGGTSASEWYNLISDHQWLYGDTKSSELGKYNGDMMYEIESGAKDTTHNVGTKGNITSETYNWKNNPQLTGKIGLMYVHDYYYSYYDGTDKSTRGNAGSYSKLANSWLFFKKDGYNTSIYYEWLMTRFGINNAGATDVRAILVQFSGEWVSYFLNSAYGVRPVFYLESKAKIVEGDGTKSSPFIINY